MFTSFVVFFSCFFAFVHSQNSNSNINSSLPQNSSNKTCNSSYSCVISGSGTEMTNTCFNKTFCPDTISIKTCFNYTCYDCSSNSIKNNDVLQLNQSNYYSKCLTKSCFKCYDEFYYMNNSYSNGYDYTYPSKFDASVKPKDMSVYLSKAFDKTIKNAKKAYRRNTCVDSRVYECFGEKDINSSSYQSSCKDLVTDFSQYYMPFQCNDWLCNFKGKCSFTNQTNTSNVLISCDCQPGFSGRKCIYNDKDYGYALNWTINIYSWLQDITKNFTVKVTDEDLVYNLVDVVSSILSFVKTMNTDDISTVTRVFGTLLNTIYNADISYKKEFTDEILLLIGITFEDAEPMIGLDPSILLSTFNAPDGTNTTGYGFYKSKINSLIDMILGKNSSSSLRLLQTASVSTGINMATPILTIPKTVSQLMPADTTFSLTFVRDPKYYSYPNQTVIQSQVISIKAYSSNNTKIFYSFPASTEKLKISLPWARVPFKLSSGTYQQNCKVYKSDGSTWKIEQSCTVDAASNQNEAVISCAIFDTLGVSCSSPSAMPMRSSSGYISLPVKLLGILIASFILVL